MQDRLRPAAASARSRGMRRHLAQQFEQQHTQRVDVGRRADTIAEDLLRRGIAQRERMHSGVGRLGVGVVEKFGDAEIEQLGRTIRRHQYIARFEIAMHDQVSVRVRDRTAQPLQQRDARVERRPRGAQPLAERPLGTASPY